MKKDLSTEEKIKTAALEVFQQKGFAGTRTRDIAEKAGINLALLNYYYRSKEKLFEIIMEESLAQLFAKVRHLVSDESTSLSTKINNMVNLYIDMLLENPNIPLFVLGEIQANPEKFKTRIGMPDSFLADTVVAKQMQEQMERAGIVNVHPLHFVINTISMTVFPFVARPLLQAVGNFNDEQFRQFLEERRTLIPAIMKIILKLDQ